MTGLYELDGVAPTVPEDGDFWIAPGAAVIGNVTLMPGASVWFNAVIRGDNEPIVIGRNTNIQEGAVLHTDPGCPLTVGDDVTVGHKAILHGCTVGDGALIGMNAVVLNRAKVGAASLVAASALITEGKEFPEGVMLMGAPAKAVGELDEARLKLLLVSAAHYAQRMRRYRKGLKPVV